MEPKRNNRDRKFDAINISDFKGLKVIVANSEDIKNYSYGEVTKPETINYRTYRPEKDGLFDERIFGPTRDFECYCGKYKRIRYKGIVCDRCGVEVTYSRVRRERMGHIYFASYLVTKIDEDKRKEAQKILADIKEERIKKLKQQAEDEAKQFGKEEKSRIKEVKKTLKKEQKELVLEETDVSFRQRRITLEKRLETEITRTE